MNLANIQQSISKLSGRIAALEGGAGHAAVTLDADAAVLLDLNTQEIGLDTQTANTVFAGPSSGAANEPTFRALVGADILAAVYPVGAIYMSVVSTSPATLFGGTWAAFGAGRVLVGIDSGDTAFDTVEETGGAKTVQSSAQTFAGNAMGTHQHAAVSAGTPTGTVAAPTFTGTSSTVIVNHTHTITSLRGASTGSATTSASGLTSGSDTSSTAVSVTTGNPDSGGAANYTPVGTNSAPAFTGSAMGTHQHDAITAGTPSGTNTPGAATSVVQPYIVVYMWKRTA